jgi:hypothetical protein
MSGLFGALVDAALGRAPVLLPRPHPIFAPADPPALLSTPTLEEADEGPQVRRESPAAGRPGRARSLAGKAADATVTENGGERKEAPPRRGRAGGRGRGNDREDAGTPSPSRFQAAAVSDVPGLPVATDGPRIEDAPRVEAPASVERRDMRRRPPGEYEPLLPPLSETPAGAPASRNFDREARLPGPAEASGEAVSADEASGSPRIDLRIGRIEVVAPAAPPAVAKASARATIVPRARPRQSLDDYLSRRRR